MSARATTRTKPASSRLVSARPLAEKGKLPTLVSTPGGLRLVRRQAGADDLRIGEADGGDAAPCPSCAGGRRRSRPPSRPAPWRGAPASARRSRRRWHRCRASRCGTGRRCAGTGRRRSRSSSSSPQPSRCGLAPDRDQDLVGGDVAGLAVRGFDPQRRRRRRQALRPRVGQDGDAELAEPLGDRRASVRRRRAAGSPSPPRRP